MKIFVRRSLTVFVLLFTLFITITVATYAWTNSTYIYSQEIIGKSRKSYFAGGVGSSLDPFEISEPEHFFNLAYLQNTGQFSADIFYFELTNSIDFDTATVDLYKTIYPVGSGDYPFDDTFYGNFYTLSNFTVDGTAEQDIGVFGNLGDGSVVQELFIESPTIMSNPSTSDDQTSFHAHNEGIESTATGYICGHLDSGATLNYVYVINPTMSSLLNADLNRSEYGLIGFNEFDGGVIVGSPRNAYSFDMDAVSASDALSYAYTQYGSTLINGSTTLELSDVLSSVGFLTAGYSLSTLLISDPDVNNDPAPQGSGNLIFLYDQLVADGYTIGANNSEYYRENIDVVGEIAFGSTNYQIFQNIGSGGLTSPLIGATFEATDYDNAIFLYVRPTNDDANLGNVTGYYSGGGQLSYLSSYDATGAYVESRYWKNSQDPNLTNFGSTGVTQQMAASAAFCAVQESGTNSITGAPIYEVVDETVTPDYYIFLVAVTNGQITISDINFTYQPQGSTAEDFASLGNIDYITTSQKAGIIADASSYTYSHLYFNYDINVNQTIEVYTEKVDTAGVISYNLDIDYSIADSSIFYFDIFNVNTSSIYITINDTLLPDNPYALIEIQFTSTGYTVSTP